MTWTKICGITNIEDARWAVECGADAIGFVFAESPRQIRPEMAAQIIRQIEQSVVAVGVFVDWPIERVKEAMGLSGCKVAQLHGSETRDYLESLSPYATIKALRVRDGVDRAALSQYEAARAILLDTYVEGRAGGTGERFDLRVAAELVREGWRVIVAGGLMPENAGEVISKVRPYGVDVSSGVEREPGRKDPDRVAQFIAAVRAADAEGS